MRQLTEQEKEAASEAFNNHLDWDDYEVIFEAGFIAGLDYNQKRICGVCFTDSWQPVPPNTPNSVPDNSTGGFMVCGYCSQQKRIEELEAKVKELQGELYQVING